MAHTDFRYLQDPIGTFKDMVFLVRGPRINFKMMGAKIVLYLVSPRGTSMMGAGWGKILLFGSLDHMEMPFRARFSNLLWCA